MGPSSPSPAQPASLYSNSGSSGAASGAASSSGGAAAAAAAAAKEVPSGPRATILWGSQTGTAEEFAGKIRAAGVAQGVPCVSIDMEDYQPGDMADEQLVVFVVATYGEGEPTSNAEAFYDWLSSADVDLSGVSFTVFGLGNTTYEHYNAVGKFIDRRLGELGASRVHPLGLGDDDKSLEEDFERWRSAGLYAALSGALGLALREGGGGAARQWRLLRQSALPAPAVSEAKARSSTFLDRGALVDHRTPMLAHVRVNRELHAEGSDRSCRHLEIETGQRLTYAPGDHLGVQPKNAPELVERFLIAAARGAEEGEEGKEVSWDSEEVVALVPADVDDDAAALRRAHLGPARLRLLAEERLNLTDPPRKALLRALAAYAGDEEEARVLRLLGATDAAGVGGEEKEEKEEKEKKENIRREESYEEWVRVDHRGVVEVLEHFSSVRAPLDVLLEHVAALAPRYYSISSSASAYPDSVHVTCVVVDWLKPSGVEHHGVCSHHLASLPSTLPVYVRTSKFRLPEDPRTPLLMVGPGTGVAPFRGFLQERRARGAESTAVLYFGCRRRDVDYLYRQELEGYLADGTLSALHVAFSREQEKKIYVQDLLRQEQNAKEAYELLAEQRGAFYICGDAKDMAPAVRTALVEIFAQHGGMTLEEADKHLDKMHEEGRFQSDTWF